MYITSRVQLLPFKLTAWMSILVQRYLAGDATVLLLLPMLNYRQAICQLQ